MADICIPCGSRGVTTGREYGHGLYRSTTSVETCWLCRGESAPKRAEVSIYGHPDDLMDAAEAELKFAREAIQ